MVVALVQENLLTLVAIVTVDEEEKIKEKKVLKIKEEGVATEDVAADLVLLALDQAETIGEDATTRIKKHQKSFCCPIAKAFFEY